MDDDDRNELTIEEKVSRDMIGEVDGMIWELIPNIRLRRDDAYLNERSVIFKEEIVGGRERVTTGEERVLRGG